MLQHGVKVLDGVHTGMVCAVMAAVHALATITVSTRSVCQVISSNPDTCGSFMVQWGMQSWPEDGKYKCLETLPAPEPHRLDAFLSQLTSSGSELKLRSVVSE